MDARIRFGRNLHPKNDQDIARLHGLIERDCGVSVEREQTPGEIGQKDGGLTIALAIAGLALSGVSTLIATLSYWKSKIPKCSISVTRGETTLSIDNLSPKKVERLISDQSVNPDEILIDIGLPEDE